MFGFRGKVVEGGEGAGVGVEYILGAWGGGGLKTWMVD